MQPAGQAVISPLLFASSFPAYVYTLQKTDPHYLSVRIYFFLCSLASVFWSFYVLQLF